MLGVKKTELIFVDTWADVRRLLSLLSTAMLSTTLCRHFRPSDSPSIMRWYCITVTVSSRNERCLVAEGF